MILIGIDCAVDRRMTGMALGETAGDRLVIQQGMTGARVDVAGQVADWLPADQPALLCMDAPLGWPSALGSELNLHSAGNALNAAPDQLFTRQTDRVVRQRTGKRPLDVGANLIARTAYAALDLLEQLREITGQEIPLAWDPGRIEATEAIEVYPAATLAVRGLQSSGYKAKTAQETRTQLAEQISREINLASVLDPIRYSDHVFDAVLCVLAGRDFLSGHCMQPEDPDLARREGWIWVRDPDG